MALKRQTHSETFALSTIKCLGVQQRKEFVQAEDGGEWELEEGT